MAVSIVRGPDGRQHKVQHPDGIASSQIIKYAQREIASVANAEDSFVVDVGKGLFTGGSQAAVSSAAGVTQWMGQSFGSDSLLQAAEDMRQYSQGIGDQVGLDEDFRESFFGQVVQGLGQVPVTIGAGAVGLAVAGPVGMYGAAALTTGGQMTSEFLTDMEQTIGKQYTDFNGSEKEAALKGMLAQTALGTTLELAAVGKAVKPLLRRLNTKGVSAKALKKAIEQDKSALREIVESGLAEGFTEASQGQSLDTLASMLYDEDRELITMDTLKRRSLEFGVGAVVGGTVSAGAQILGSPGKTSTTNKDLGKPVEGRSEVSVPREIEVTYKPVDGSTTTVILAPNEGESAIDAAERILEGRRLPGSDMTVNEVIEQTPIDVVLGEPDAEILEEDVPVDPAPTPDPDSEPAPDLNVSYQDVIQDPEYLSKGKDIRDKLQRGEITLEEATNQDNALRRNIEARIPREQTATPAPAPEPSVETAPESEVDTSTGLPSFSLPKNLRGGRPRYKQSEPIKFASDLERAAYSATTPTRSDPAKRKRDGYRKLLEDDGYTSTEINTMGREIRSQMREQYENPGDELSVALPQDIVAQAAPLTSEQGSVNLTQNERKFFNSFLENQANREELLEEVPSLRISEGKLSIAPQDIDNFSNFVTAVGVSDGLGTVPPRLKTSQFYQPFLKSGAEDIVAQDDTILTEQDIKDGKEGEHGVVVDTPVTGDVVADAAAFKPSRPVIVPDAPVIKRSSLRGKSGFIYFSDRTRVGTYTGLNPDSQISIPLQGGMGYAFIPQNVQAEAGWAFTSDNIFTRFRDKVNETDGIGYVALYTKENLRANGTFLLAYIAEVKYALASGKLTQADFRSEINGLRERFLAKKVKDKDFISRDVEWYSLWNKKWKTPEDLQAALDAAGFETRAAAFSAKKATTKNAKPGDLSGGQLASKRSVKKGMPDVIGMIDLFVEPDLADRKRGEIIGAVQFQQGQESAVVAGDIGSDEHFSYPLVIRGRGIGVFDSTVNVLDVIKTQKEKNQALRSAETSFPTSSEVGSTDVTAQAAETAVEDRGPQDTFENGSQVIDFIEKFFNPIADKLGITIRPSMSRDYEARYNVTQRLIEYNPMALLNRSKAGVQAAMREEIIHAAMHSVLIQKAKKTKSRRSESQLWVEFFTALGNNLTPQERAEMKNVYQTLQEGDTVGFGAEYSRAVVQKVRYGDLTEQYIALDKGSPAFQAVVELLRSVQAYMAKVLGPMVKTDPEAAQVIVDTVELLNAIDPSIRPKNQDVVANAYNETDKNTAEENTDPGESVDAKASERIREERKWFADSSLRKTASKFLTPVITRLNRINPMFGRMLQQLDTSIRERSFRHQKQTKAFFNKLNAIKGAEFLEMKQLLFFSPTPEEATHPINKAKMQRRDALLHKYGLLNMYRLDVQPIMEEIYAEYTKLGMPAMGYLEDYFPRVVKDLEGLINSYGQKSKRTFELLVREENERRSALKDKDGNDASLPEMNDTERARFFQDFLQNKFRVDINGARLPGNVKVRDIQLIPEDKLKFYDDPGIAFGKYTANMNRAIESFKVVGDTRKGKGSLQGELGKLTEELFSAGQIDNADADTVKSLTELITTQFQAENEILKSLGTLTYMATLINPGPVLVQIMDLYKVALYRGLGGVVSGVYRTVTGNRRFDLEDDLSISKTQLSAEFQDASVLQKALDFGLSRLVPFRQMDTAMKHASIEAAYDDFLKKAKSPVGSKKYNQLLSELTITMGRKDALETIEELKLNKAMESSLVKEALLAELLQRQPLTYLQVPEGYQTDPSKRLFYKLSTFMLLDLNYNRQEFMNDLGGPGKTLQQRTAALRRLTYMATLLTMFGLPSDLLDDWISGKDTYIPEHVMNNMLGMFGLSKYTTTRALEKGTVESVIQRFTPPAVNIIVKGEESLRSWVKGDVELFEMKAWRNSPLSDVWYNRTGAGKKQQEKLQKLRRKEGVRPSIDRS